MLNFASLRRIYRSARRTLHTSDDLLPPFDKLVHPVGICLRGTWRITEHTRYTGYFRQGSEGLLIARASDNMGENRPGRLRFMGLAGKLYPTSDPHHVEPLCTANFVMNENLVGTHTPHFVDARLATDLLPLGIRLDGKVAMGALSAALFAVADRATHLTQGMMRQLYPIAMLGERAPEQAVAPVVMRFVGAASNRRVDTPELREELSMAHHPEGIRYAIEVADGRAYLKPQRFERIGEVHFTESVASWSGDHRLHFQHPPFLRPARW